MTDDVGRRDPPNSGGTDPRERVDRRKWAIRHLRTALEAELIDETDYHASMARQLLATSGSSDTDRREGATRVLYDET